MCPTSALGVEDEKKSERGRMEEIWKKLDHWRLRDSQRVANYGQLQHTLHQIHIDPGHGQSLVKLNYMINMSSSSKPQVWQGLC